MAICQPLPGQGLRKFWTYAPGACGSSADSCVGPCGLPGFTLTVDPATGQGALSTAGRAVSIAMLILMTRAALADGSQCSRMPQKRNGYWADSFRSDGGITGSQIYYVPTNTTVQASVALVKAYAENDLKKMVTMGEAESVKVDAKYAGAGTIRLTASIVIDGQNLDVPFAAAGTGGTWAVGLL